MLKILGTTHSGKEPSQQIPPGRESSLDDLCTMVPDAVHSSPAGDAGDAGEAGRGESWKKTSFHLLSLIGRHTGVRSVMRYLEDSR